MSAKQVEASVKKLVALGYSKSKSQKAMKECGNNYNQAKTWLERTKEDDERKAHEAELAKKAAAHAEKVKKEEAERREREANEPHVDVTASTKRHPCVAQYGSCRYGASCMFKELPADTCINYVLGTCLYGDTCRNRHAINGVDIRKMMDPDRDDEHEYIRMENGDYVQVKRNGKVQEGAVWVKDYEEETVAAPLPEPSAFSGDSGSVPTYSEPLHHQQQQHQHHQHHQHYQQQQQYDQYDPYGQQQPQQGELDIWGNPIEMRPGAFVPSQGESSGLVGFTLTANAHTPVSSPNTTSAAAPAPFLQKARIGQHVQQPAPKPVMKVVQPAPAAPPPQPTGPAAKSHPCVVQMGECRFGDRCNHATMRGDVCVHWLNQRCRNAPDECRYYHEFILVGQQPRRPKPAPGARSGATSESPGVSATTPPVSPGMAGASSTAPGTGGSFYGGSMSDPSIWGAPPAAFGSAPLGPRPTPSSQDPEAWTKAFDAPSREETARMNGDQVVARMHADVALHEAQSVGAPAPAGKWRAASAAVLASPKTSASSAPQADSAEEARAFDALREVFPDVDPSVILQALRKCGNDRKLVANAIMESTPENVEKTLQANVDEHLATSKTLALLTLHEMVPAMEPSSLERILSDCKGDFGEALRIAVSTTENIVASDPNNQWASGTTTDANTGRPTGYTPQETMKLDRLQGMYRELDRFVIEKAFERAKRNTTDAVAILNHLNSDLKLVARETREEWGNEATRKAIGTAARQQQQQQGASSAAAKKKPAAKPAKASADDFSFTVTSCDDGASAPDEAGASATDATALSSSALYKETKDEANDHSDWRRTRQEAYMTNAARVQMMGLAIQAYARQQHDVGKNLLRKAQELKRRYERLNMLAMHALERERSGQQGVSTLDLHGFHVDEAQDVLARRVEMCLRKRVTKLRVVVGHGNHSKSGKSVIYPRVLSQLRADPRVSVKSVLPAEIVVTVDLTH